MTIGFVGLGSIGRPMVESMLRDGVPVAVHDLDVGVMDELAGLGAQWVDRLDELAALAQVVGVCVPADAHVRAVLDGPAGLLAHLPAGATVAIHSTVAPATILWAAELAGRRDIAVVEAAVTGGFLAAADGRSTFLLGGDPSTFPPLEPLLAACGAQRVHAGGLGSASRLKLCLNLQTYATFLGVYEAATLASRVGLDLDALKAAMRANGQLSEVVDGYLILHALDDDTLSEASMQDALAGYAAIIAKDLDLIRALAADAGIEVPTAELAADRARRVYFLHGDGP